MGFAILPVLLCAAPAHADDREGDRTAKLLADLVRIDTSNPPGDTRPIADHLKHLFDTAGIANEIIIAPNGKAAHFIARLKGDGSRRPILLAAHTDVVPADRTRWTVDPFGGIIKDGYLYGRGTLDNKGAVAAFARAMLRIKADGVPLARDIIFLAEADEEQGSYNTNWLAVHHWDKIDAEFSLNEGGSIRSVDGRITEIAVSYADKLTVNLRLRADGPAGHSSRPLGQDVSANDQLVAALGRLATYREPIMLTPATNSYLKALADLHPKELGDPVTKLLSATMPSERDDAAAAVIAAGDRVSGWGMEGLLRNTAVLTMLQSGLKPNIIPGTAEATLNARLMPGTDLDAFLARLRAAIGNDRISLTVLEGDGRAKLIKERSQIAPSPITSDLYRLIEKTAKIHWPAASVLPTLLVASTDATPWRQHGVPVFGIAPFPVSGADASHVHGDDERVSLTAIAQGADYIHDLVRNAAATVELPKRNLP
jgi:acetylornithine deacetylase/succinyl-diaminopimelate desuccinylase-like protein